MFARTMAAVSVACCLIAATSMALYAQYGTVPGSQSAARVQTPGDIARRSLGWVVSSAPTVRIGTAYGSDAYMFHQVSAAVQLRGGEILVMDSSGQRRYFNQNGLFLRSLGRTGEGPGELVQPSIVPSWPRDTLIVANSGLARLTLFSADGMDFYRTAAPHYGAVAGVVGSRAVSIRTSVRIELRPSIPASVAVSLWSLDGSEHHPIVEYANVPHMYAAESPGRPALIALLPFAPRLSVAAGPDGFFMAPGLRPEIFHYDATGRLSRVLEVTEPPRAVTASDFERLIELKRSEGVPDERLLLWRQVYREGSVPPSTPTLQALRVDSSGFLWAEAFRAHPSDPATWLIFNSSGRAIGSVLLPTHLRVMDIGEDYVLGIARDALGVEYVERYSLTRR